MALKLIFLLLAVFSTLQCPINNFLKSIDDRRALTCSAFFYAVGAGWFAYKAYQYHQQMKETHQDEEFDHKVKEELGSKLSNKFLVEKNEHHEAYSQTYSRTAKVKRNSSLSIMGVCIIVPTVQFVIYKIVTWALNIPSRAT